VETVDVPVEPLENNVIYERSPSESGGREDPVEFARFMDTDIFESFDLSARKALLALRKYKGDEDILKFDDNRYLKPVDGAWTILKENIGLIKSNDYFDLVYDGVIPLHDGMYSLLTKH